MLIGKENHSGDSNAHPCSSLNMTSQTIKPAAGMVDYEGDGNHRVEPEIKSRGRGVPIVAQQATLLRIRV